jgi:Pyridoxamine 5'-phosphate oxidase
MTGALQQDEVARRLASKPIGWLTTVNPDGQPQSSPVWFIWDGGSLWLRSPATGDGVAVVADRRGEALRERLAFPPQRPLVGG